MTKVFNCERCQNRIISPLAYAKSKKPNQTPKIKFNNLTINKKCEVCEGEMILSGPFWISEIQDVDFMDSLLTELNEDYTYLKYKDRIVMLINTIKEELSLKQVIFSYDYSILARDIHLSSPKLSLIK